MPKKTDYKSWITIAVFIIMLLGYGTKIVLIHDQVRRNTEILEKYNLVLIDHKLNTLIELLDE